MLVSREYRAYRVRWLSISCRAQWAPTAEHKHDMTAVSMYVAAGVPRPQRTLEETVIVELDVAGFTTGDARLLVLLTPTLLPAGQPESAVRPLQARSWAPALLGNCVWLVGRNRTQICERLSVCARWSGWQCFRSCLHQCANLLACVLTLVAAVRS
jgi:uncharacterized membrane protein